MSMSSGEQDGPNPYAAPARDGDDFAPRPVQVAADGRMFSPMQIGVATVFLGSVLAGALLLQANYRAMRENLAANVVIAIGLAASVGLYLAATSVHDLRAALAIVVVATATFCWFASSLQRERFTDHVLAGGPRGSNWWVVGAILLSVGLRLSTIAAVKVIVRALARRI